MERVDSRGMLSGLQEFSGFILQHRHLHIFPFFIIIIFLTPFRFPPIQIVDLCYKFILRFSVFILSRLLSTIFTFDIHLSLFTIIKTVYPLFFYSKTI